MKQLIRLIIGGIIFSAAILLSNLWLFILSYIIVGGDVVFKAVKNIFTGEVFDENLLMSIASIGAFFVGDFAEGTAVMIFYQVGELFQDYAVNRSRKSISSLMDIRPEYANLKKENEFVEVSPYEVSVGDVIMVKPGEKVPLDGEIIDGNSYVDTTALTGESVPREVLKGDEVLSGCVNINGVIYVQVTKGFEQSTASKILDLVENASNKKSNSEKFITKFARYYTPIVVIAALIIAVIPPLLFGGRFSDWIYRALTFLVVSCPCALVISIPLSFFGGIGGSSRIGILVKGGNYLEALADAEVIAFDKTGTLTKGVFKVQQVESIGISEDCLLKFAAHAENYSSHPIAQSIKKAYGKSIEENSIKDIEERPGKGIVAVVEGQRVAVGNTKLMKDIGCDYTDCSFAGTVIHVAIDSQYSGYITISDEIKEEAKEVISDLKNNGIKDIVMLTGDNKIIGEDVAEKLGIDHVYTELMPADKVTAVQQLIDKKKNGKVIFVGDGINDAPVLACADIGVAMGKLGSDAAIEAADIVIMTDELTKIPKAMQISKKTIKIANQNIVFSIAIKVAVLILSALGLTTMWWAVFADVGVAAIAILNSFRTLSVKK